MLKDIVKKLAKTESNQSFTDKIKNNLIDGFVDVKAYREDKLVYHDAGDNVVTDWMRHTIMLLLTGDSFSKLGNTDYTTNGPINTLLAANHNSTTKINRDGYILNGKQYFWDGSAIPGFYSKSDVSTSNIFPFFPTKVLFGTGKEYTDWNSLADDTKTSYPTYYEDQVATFGGGTGETTAQTVFNGPAIGSGTTDDPLTLNATFNHYSSSLANNTFVGSAALAKTRTVNDPDSNRVTNPSSTLNVEYGITGAIKTPYFSYTGDATKLEDSTDSQGKLLKPKWRGVGRPAFIYFNTPTKDGATSVRSEAWADATSGAEIILTRDSSTKYLEKITFNITMLEQSGSNDNLGSFYPYNGWTLKQIGLFNDSRMSYTADAATYPTTDAYYQYNNMPCGIMLAKKHIVPFTKTADLRVVLSWVLSI